jgi:hypothetical protein
MEARAWEEVEAGIQMAVPSPAPDSGVEEALQVVRVSGTLTEAAVLMTPLLQYMTDLWIQHRQVLRGWGVQAVAQRRGVAALLQDRCLGQ